MGGYVDDSSNRYIPEVVKSQVVLVTFVTIYA